MLTIPTPTLEFDALAPGHAAREKPLTITLGPVERDGVGVGPADLAVVGLHAFRWLAPGATTEVWDKDAAAWVPEPSADLFALAVEALAFRQDDARPWLGIVVPAGGADSAGGPQFARAADGFPSYAFRARTVATDGSTAVSPPTPNLTFGSVTDTSLIALGPDEGEQPEGATLVRLELRNPALVTIGELVIRRAAPGAEVLVANAAGAAVVLQPDGSIELRPAPGRGVRVAGDLETERIVYAPAGGGLKKTLA